MGKMVDMAALAAKNEHVRAVGNMKVNARGDIIDDHGRIVKTITERTNEHYAKTVGNRSAHQLSKKPTTTNQSPVQADIPVQPKLDEQDEPMELSLHEIELEENKDEDIEIEKIKAEDVKKEAKKKNAR
jgi:hypothetical protein